jgi:GNAT superfamily N-acetyltransferase
MIHLTEEPVVDLREHTAIPSAYESTTMFDVVQGRSGFDLVERKTVAHRRSFDDFEDPVAAGLDTGNWGLISAFAGPERIGGIVLALATPGLARLEGRADLGVIWDIRVAPAWRRQSVATGMLYAARLWAWQRGCRELKAETENINPGACDFFRHHGFVLSQVLPGPTPQLPARRKLVWRMALDD